MYVEVFGEHIFFFNKACRVACKHKNSLLIKYYKQSPWFQFRLLLLVLICIAAERVMMFEDCSNACHW